MYQCIDGGREAVADWQEGEGEDRLIVFCLHIKKRCTYE